MKKILILFCLIIISSCGKEKTLPLNLDIPNKEKDVAKLIDYNVSLELKSHEEFILQLNKDKELFFYDKVDKFLESYDSFGFFNVMNRKFFKSETAIQSKVDAHLRLVINPIDYQTFEEKKVNEYVEFLKDTRKEFNSYQGNIANVKWVANSMKFDFYDTSSSNVIENLEGAFKEQVLLYVMDGIDWFLLILVILSIIGLPLSFSGLHWFIEIFLVIITFILSFVFENIRERRISDNIMDSIKTKIISVENKALLEQLNVNTKNYYYGKN